MFSEMLREMDRNTVRYMVDDMQEKLEKQKLILAKNEKALANSEKALAEKEAEIQRLRDFLASVQKD